MTDVARPPAVLSVGRLYCDLIFTDVPRLPTLGTEIFAGGFGVHAGGGAYITAAHLAALGHASSLATMLPSSGFSDLIRGEIEASGVDLSLSASLEEAAGPQLTVSVVQDGDRAFLTKRAGPAFPPLALAEVERRGIAHIHIGELASLVAVPDIIPLARALGVTVSLDCGWDDGLDAAAAAPLIRSVDVFLPNEAEVAALRAHGVAEPLAPLTVIKRGATGAKAVSPAGSITVPTEPLRAVDTTGAGDAFNAGFLSAWLCAAPLEACLTAGNRRGTLSVRRRGGFAPDAAAAQAGGVRD
ncbi:MAG: carbohydrate kinase family protein [Pseudomonadota bacterium]